MAKPTIIYFDIRARAEPIRLILEELGIEYEDQQVRPEEWPGRGILRFGRATRSTGTLPESMISTAPMRNSAYGAMSSKRHSLT